MNTEEAAKFLQSKGIRVDRINKKEFRVWDINGNVWLADRDRFFTQREWWGLPKANDSWTGREIVKLARSYTDSNQQTSLHKNVKKFSNDKDRTATRDAIKKEDFDKIPAQKRTAESNPWCWD